MILRDPSRCSVQRRIVAPPSTSSVPVSKRAKRSARFGSFVSHLHPSRRQKRVKGETRMNRRKPRIAVIGRGNVGNSLRQGIDKAGYEVRVTGKDPDRVESVGPLECRAHRSKQGNRLSAEPLFDVNRLPFIQVRRPVHGARPLVAGPSRSSLQCKSLLTRATWQVAPKRHTTNRATHTQVHTSPSKPKVSAPFERHSSSSLLSVEIRRVGRSGATRSVPPPSSCSQATTSRRRTLRRSIPGSRALRSAPHFPRAFRGHGNNVVSVGSDF